VPSRAYRVTDEDSRTQLNGRGDFEAPGWYRRPLSYPMNEHEMWIVRKELGKQEDWRNRMDTALISVYSSKTAAYASARARIRQGKRDVRVTYINLTALKKNDYRDVISLAFFAGFRIPRYVGGNADHEIVV
jgi:hypothetical protein